MQAELNIEIDFEPSTEERPTMRSPAIEEHIVSETRPIIAVRKVRRCARAVTIISDADGIRLLHDGLSKEQANRLLLQAIEKILG